MSCCTYGCTGAHGCAAHTEPFHPELQPVVTHDEPGLTVTEWSSPLVTRNGGATIEDGESNHPWSDLSRFESTAIWIISGLCALLVSYLCFLAWRQFY